MVTNPLVIMPSSTGKNESIFSCEFDDLDHDRQVLREAQNLRRMDVARMSESDMPTQHGRSSDVHFSRFQYNRLMKRQMIKSIILAKKDSEQDGIAWNLHGHTHFIVLRLAASRYPAHTAIRQQITDAPIFAPARNHSPSFIRLSVCRLKDENVV